MCTGAHSQQPHSLTGCENIERESVFMFKKKGVTLRITFGKLGMRLRPIRRNLDTTLVCFGEL